MLFFKLHILKTEWFSNECQEYFPCQKLILLLNHRSAIIFTLSLFQSHLALFVQEVYQGLILHIRNKFTQESQFTYKIGRK